MSFEDSVSQLLGLLPKEAQDEIIKQINISNKDEIDYYTLNSLIMESSKKWGLIET